MPTLSAASTTRPLADQLGGGSGEPPVSTPRKRPAKKTTGKTAAKKTAAKKVAAEVEAPTDEDPAAEQALSPPLPRPAERGGAKGTVAKFIRFPIDEAKALEEAASELRCSQTDLVKSAVAHYLELLRREREHGELEEAG